MTYIEKKSIPIANDNDVIEATLYGKKVVTKDTSDDGTFTLVSYHYKDNIYIVDESFKPFFFRKLFVKVKTMVNTLVSKIKFS